MYGYKKFKENGIENKTEKVEVVIEQRLKSTIMNEGASVVDDNRVGIEIKGVPKA